MNWFLCSRPPIERFHSRAQHLCEFIEKKKESVYIRKEYTYPWIILVHEYGRRDVIQFPWLAPISILQTDISLSGALRRHFLFPT